MSRNFYTLLGTFVIGMSLLLSCSQKQSGPAAKIDKLVGMADVVRNGKTIPLALSDKLFQGDVIRTLTNGVVVVILKDGLAKIEIQKNSEFSLSDTSSKTKLNLIKGSAWTLVEKLKQGSTFAEEGPTSVVGVRGTKFYMFDAGDGMQGICHCEGDSDFTDKTTDKTSVHTGNSLVFMKGGKTIILTAQELDAIKFVHHHSAINDSIVGAKNDTPKDVEEKLQALIKKKFAELK